MAALDRIREDFVRTLDTFEERIILVILSGSGLLVGVVFEDLLAVSFLDLLVGRLVAVLGEAEDCVVILSLHSLSV